MSLNLHAVGLLATSVTKAQLAAYFDVTERQINRQIKQGMPASSLADAEAWRANRPSPHVPGVAKRQRLDGEVSAVAMATALGISQLNQSSPAVQRWDA